MAALSEKINDAAFYSVDPQKPNVNKKGNNADQSLILL